MHNTAKHTPGPLNKAIHAIPMLYAEAFAGSNNKEFVVELYKDAQLLETAAPAMYEALKEALDTIAHMRHYYAGNKLSVEDIQKIVDDGRAALAQADGKQ